MNLEPGEQPSLASLAVGTHNRRITRIESPNGRGQAPAPPASSHTPVMPGLHPEAPDEYLGTVLGSYRVIESLGKGGMGHVYRAEHIKLGREVAIKLLRSDYASRRDAVARFFQEARTVNRVRHRNIVDVTDFVELDDGTTFIIMELLAGASLGAWARSGIDLPRALAVLIQICDGLAAAHQVGVVHRDLKPDNVIVVPTSDGADLVKLLDFGVAKLLNRDDEDVGFETAAGAVIGTPAYMSPEQAGGMVIDARSDIYSLGAIMYEMFCGQPMFRGRSFGEYVRKHLTELPVPPRQTPGGAQLDPQLEAVILKALEKDAEHRFSQIGELRDALLAMLGGMVTEDHRSIFGPRSPREAAYAPPLGQRSGAHASPSQLGVAFGYASPPRAATRRWVWLAGGALALGLGTVAVVRYAGRGGPSIATGPAPVIADPAPPAVQPAAQPSDPPAARPKIVEVRFDSLPSGGVFAETPGGLSAELCRTPCTFNIDLSDGGPADRRGFAVKREGYIDGAITVDLTGEKREFHVMLQHAATAAPADTERPEHDDRADRAPAAKDVVKADPKPEKRPTRRTLKSTRPTKQGDNDRKDGATGHDPPETKDARDPDRDHSLDPSDGPPVPTKKPPAKQPTIDPSDTLDPFHRKS